MGFHKKGASSKDSSFDDLFFDDDTKGDQAVASKPSSSHVIGASTSPALLVLEMQVVILRSERARDYIQVYRITYKKDLIDDDIKDHLECKGQPNEVSWIKLFENFKVDELSLKNGYVSGVK